MIKNKNERGQSLVELALSIVVLMFLLAGAVEFGIAFFQYIQLRDAVQEGALYGSLNPTDTAGITARVRYASTSPIDLSDTSKVTVGISGGSGCANGTDAITVTASYDHIIFMPFARLFMTSPRPINASATDTILNPACP